MIVKVYQLFDHSLSVTSVYYHPQCLSYVNALGYKISHEVYYVIRQTS